MRKVYFPHHVRMYNTQKMCAAIERDVSNPKRWIIIGFRIEAYKREWVFAACRWTAGLIIPIVLVVVAAIDWGASLLRPQVVEPDFEHLQ